MLLDWKARMARILILVLFIFFVIFGDWLLISSEEQFASDFVKLLMILSVQVTIIAPFLDPNIRKAIWFTICGYGSTDYAEIRNFEIRSYVQKHSKFFPNRTLNELRASKLQANRNINRFLVLSISFVDHLLLNPRLTSHEIAVRFQAIFQTPMRELSVEGHLRHLVKQNLILRTTSPFIKTKSYRITFYGLCVIRNESEILGFNISEESLRNYPHVLKIWEGSLNDALIYSIKEKWEDKSGEMNTEDILLSITQEIQELPLDKLLINQKIEELQERRPIFGD